VQQVRDRGRCREGTVKATVDFFETNITADHSERRGYIRRAFSFSVPGSHSECRHSDESAGLTITYFREDEAFIK